MKTEGDHMRPQGTPQRAGRALSRRHCQKNLSPSRRLRKNVFDRCQL